MKFLQLRHIGIHTPVSRFKCPEAPPVHGRALFSLNHVKKVFYNPEERKLVIDYIGDSKPVTLCNISEKVYDRIVDELTISSGNTVLNLKEDGCITPIDLYEIPSAHLGPVPPPNKFSP